MIMKKFLSERFTHLLVVYIVKRFILSYGYLWSIILRCLHKGLVKHSVNLWDD